MEQIDGEAGRRVLEYLNPVFPDLARMIIEYSFGDVYSRNVLSKRESEIAVVSALSARGNAFPQLKVHLNGALNCGVTPEEIKEVILNVSGYAGFPCVINALGAFIDVCGERKIPTEDFSSCSGKIENEGTRFERGRRMLETISTGQVGKLDSTIGTICPDLVRFTVELGYGDIYSRTSLPVKERQIAIIAALAAMGGTLPQLEFHIEAGRNIGLSWEELCEIMILMTVYCGFPAALNGVNAVMKVKSSKDGTRAAG
jgi:4-carboxymuconolactone decarboxylase